MEKTTKTQTHDSNGSINKFEETTTSDLDQSFRSLGSPGEYRVTKGIAPIEHKDYVNEKATFAGLLEFVKVRKSQIVSRKHETHFDVNSRAFAISLVIGEHGGQRVEGGTYLPTVHIHGSSKFTVDHSTVTAIMSMSHRPHELALKLRELPHLFSDEASWADTVAKLRNLSLVVSKTIKDTSNEDTGEREKALKLVIESGTVALEWKWRYTIYEGTDPVDVPVRVLYEADENMSGVLARVFNPRKVLQERKALEELLAKTVASIREVLGDAIPIVQLNA